MAVRKVLGYVLIIIGFLVFLLSFSQVAKIVNISISGMVSNIILVVGLVVLGVGAFLLSKDSSGKVEEVPIYAGKKGNEVVGFRRIKK